MGAGLLAPRNALALQTNGFSDAVPTIISYHGTLRDAEGNPLSGIHEMVFRIYNDVTAPTSEAVWTEEHAQVTVRDGQFNVLLGDLEPISADIFQNANRFIGITVDDLDEMVPRQRFAAVPYAIAAAGATYLSASDGDPLKAVSVDVDGQVGIGTESPEAPLHVQADGQNMHISGNSINVSDTVKMNDSTAGNVSVAAGGGNFGIGTTEPTKLLQVSGDNPEVNLEFGPGATSTVAEISVSEGENKLASIGYNKTTHSMGMQLSDGTTFTMLDQKVGIGTNAPITTLDVAGDLHATGNINTDGLIRVRNKPPVLILRMRDLANDNDANTRISADDYDCVATSWLGEWDINEDSNGVSGVWTHVVGNTWFIRAEMNSDNPHERLDVDMLCFLRALTEYPLDRRTMNTPN